MHSACDWRREKKKKRTVHFKRGIFRYQVMEGRNKDLSLSAATGPGGLERPFTDRWIPQRMSEK